jgi:hypothetical protein
MICITGRKLVGYFEPDGLIMTSWAGDLAALYGSIRDGSLDQRIPAIMPLYGDPACGEEQQNCYYDICGFFQHQFNKRNLFSNVVSSINTGIPFTD